MYSTQVSQLVKAPRSAVYRALLDPAAVAKWRVPTGMSGHVHEFDAREGGSLRVSLTYEAPDNAGKSTAHTDSYHGHFVKIVPDQQVVEVVEFETDDPALRGGGADRGQCRPARPCHGRCRSVPRRCVAPPGRPGSGAVTVASDL